ncbi:hypothetical protein Q4E93_05525 [Flavitalea sp. BT771]|uniref:hypothetical protein n=1 Tax=Flavitalea sp. BT771 TaxID=3063329 RepID=UPI0026E2EF8D|nr:hypothetical protein [Flavitalea sp. BT771]MDO6430033.1 hypothetical protein [Flavitalea sp. BT771]MDV6219828.1 hypothetical protein [Flavitalea sp. BT771]
MKYEDLLKTQSAEIIERLLTDVLSKDAVEVHFNFEDDDQWSFVTMHIYEEDKEFSLRLHQDGLYDLLFGYYDEDDEFFEIVQPLTEEEKKMIPERLKKVMAKVLADEKGMRLPKDFLSR